MTYYGKELSGYAKTVALIVIIILSFVAGHYIEKMVNFIFKFLHKYYCQIITFFKMKISPISGMIMIIISSILSFLFALGKIQSHRIVTIVLLIQLLYLFFYRVLVNPVKSTLFNRYFDLAIVISFLTLIFRGNWLALFGILTFISFLLLLITKSVGHWKAVISVLIITIVGIVGSEYLLRKYSPVEINTWGELPALQADNETIFSLIPNKRTHLRYNNYNYTLVTNSLGFASPEISLGPKTENEIRIMITGDAFSMPEGMEYEYSYPALLEKKLKDQFPVKTIKIINAGVTGYGPNEVYGQVKKFIDLVNPDIIINEMFINEFLEINFTRDERLSEIGLLDNGSKNIRIREKLMIMGNFQLAIQIPFYLKNLAGANENYNYNKSLMFFYEKDSPFYNDSVITKLNNFIVNMKEICFNHQTELIVMGVPGQVEVTDPKYIYYFPKSVNLNDTVVFDLNKPLLIFENLCKNNNIKFLNSKIILKNSAIQPLYFEKSWHWNKNGHKVIAGYLSEQLKSNKIFN
jgi:hypothetical protein